MHLIDNLLAFNINATKLYNSYPIVCVCMYIYLLVIRLNVLLCSIIIMSYQISSDEYP